MLILSSVAAGGIWYTVYSDNSFTVQATVRDVQQVGNDITLTAVVRMTNHLDKPVYIYSVSVSIYTDNSKAMKITSFTVNGIAIQPGQTVEKEQQITLQNIDSTGRSIYVVIDLSGRAGLDSFTQHIERDVAF